MNIQDLDSYKVCPNEAAWVVLRVLREAVRKDKTFLNSHDMSRAALWLYREAAGDKNVNNMCAFLNLEDRERRAIHNASQRGWFFELNGYHYTPRDVFNAIEDMRVNALVKAWYEPVPDECSVVSGEE